MKRPMAALFVAAGLAALAAGYLASDFERFGSSDTTARFEAPALPDSSGAERDPSEWRGRPILVNFWATWCAPCRDEIPLLVEAQRQYASQGLKVLGIAVDDAEAVAGFEKRFEMNYPSLVGQTEGMDILRQYGGGSGLPFTLAVDSEGTIRAHKLGRVSRSEVDRLISAALAVE